MQCNGGRHVAKPTLKLQTKITLLVCLVVAFILAIIFILFNNKFAEQTRQSLEERVVAVSRTVALTPSVQQVLAGEEGAFDIQEYTGKIKRLNNVEFVVVFDMNGIRISHPNSELIGEKVHGGDIEDVLHGKHTISVAEGTLGKSLRSFAPIFDRKGNQVGAVLTGIMLERLEEQSSEYRWILVWGLGLGAIIGTIGAFVLARKIKKTIYNMEPFQIAKLLEERSAMLQFAKEGIIAVDEDLQITLINNEGRRLFHRGGLPSKLVDEPIERIWEQDVFATVKNTGEAIVDEEMQLGGVVIHISIVPIIVDGTVKGIMATFRDKTEMLILGERLSGLSSYAEALRAQAHEFRNKLHVIFGMVHMKYYAELERYISDTMESQDSEVGATSEQIRDQVLTGFILGKMSRAREAGVVLELTKDSFLPEPRRAAQMHHLITILGNFIDNAVECLETYTAKEQDPKIQLSINYDEMKRQLICTVTDNGPGISEQEQLNMFSKGYSTKGENRGMGLYLVMLRINELHGKLEYWSEPLKGTTFEISIPYELKEPRL